MAKENKKEIDEIKDEPKEIKATEALNKVGKAPDVFKQSEVKKKTVIFRENRKKEITIGRETLVFLPGKENPQYCINESDPKNNVDKYKEGVPESLLNHKDFQSQIKYFIIK